MTRLDADRASNLVSRAFLASPVFAGIDEARYSAERVQSLIEENATILATDQDRIVGSITIFPPSPASECEAFRSRYSFGLLAVEPTLAGRGIAKELIDSAEKFARNVGAEELCLSVTKRGEALVRLYEAVGYATFAEFQWPGVPDPSFLMRKPLP